MDGWFGTVLEIIAGACLVCWSLRQPLKRLIGIVEVAVGANARFMRILWLLLSLLLGLIGSHLILDPLVPGQATVHVSVIDATPTQRETLRVRLVPIRSNGKIDPQRMTHHAFSKAGRVSTRVRFYSLERFLRATLYDAGRPDRVLADRIVPVSMFAKVGFRDVHIAFPVGR